MRARDPDANLFATAFTYNPFTGKLSRTDGTMYKNHPVNGYLCVWFENRHTFEHRIAWLCMTGRWPENDVDHVNRVRHHNAWHNLRPATDQENAFNRVVHKNNKLGVKGIRLTPTGYEARIMKNYRAVCLGRYPTIEMAIAVRELAVKELHNAF